MVAGQANHLIPVELALKVASKIEAGEPFGCVVILPMYSEGTSSSTLAAALPSSENLIAHVSLNVGNTMNFSSRVF